MVQAVTKNLTLAEFLQLPETKPASEYFDGQIIQKPMPQGKRFWSSDRIHQIALLLNTRRDVPPERLYRVLGFMHVPPKE